MTISGAAEAEEVVSAADAVEHKSAVADKIEENENFIVDSLILWL